MSPPSPSLIWLVVSAVPSFSLLLLLSSKISLPNKLVLVGGGAVGLVVDVVCVFTEVGDGVVVCGVVVCVCVGGGVDVYVGVVVVHVGVLVVDVSALYIFTDSLVASPCDRPPPASDRSGPLQAEPEAVSLPPSFLRYLLLNSSFK